MLGLEIVFPSLPPRTRVVAVRDEEEGVKVKIFMTTRHCSKKTKQNKKKIKGSHAHTNVYLSNVGGPFSLLHVTLSLAC